MALAQVSDEGLRKEVDKGLFKSCFMLILGDKAEGKPVAAAARDAVVAFLIASLHEVCACIDCRGPSVIVCVCASPFFYVCPISLVLLVPLRCRCTTSLSGAPSTSPC